MRNYVFLLLLLCCSRSALALSLAPEEFQASRTMTCVLAEESLGYLSEQEYGTRMHTVLDEFNEAERENILAKALGYYEGLIFEIDTADEVAINGRLAYFVASTSCPSDMLSVTHAL
ncbi:MAG: hypothetical protein ACI9B9_000421 [Halioglobus sp.]|jgi:hypothetical protein